MAGLIWEHGGAGVLQRDHIDLSGIRISVGVNCRFSPETLRTVALLDTGSEWSVLGEPLASDLDDGVPLGSVPMSTRLGRFIGRIHRVPVTLLSELGTDVTIAATVLLTPDWPGPPILGFTGCLERVRFALVPSATGQHTWVHFAPTS